MSDIVAVLACEAGTVTVRLHAVVTHLRIWLCRSESRVCQSSMFPFFQDVSDFFINNRQRLF